LLRWDLVVQQLLNVVDRKKMLSVHRNDNGVPNLGDQNLWLVLDFHVGCSQYLGVDTLGKSREDVSPRTPDRDTEVEGSCHRADSVQNDIPHVSVQEEQSKISDEHDTEKDLGLQLAENVANDGITDTMSDLHGGKVSDRITE